MYRGYIPSVEKGLFSKASTSTLEKACPPVQWVPVGPFPYCEGLGSLI